METKIDHVENNARLLKEARDREVNSPEHYKLEGDLEVIDIIDMAVVDIRDGKEAAYLANILKYILRYRGKGGVTSLMKASFYLLRLISHIEVRNDKYETYRPPVKNVPPREEVTQ